MYAITLCCPYTSICCLSIWKPHGSFAWTMRPCLYSNYSDSKSSRLMHGAGKSFSEDEMFVYKFYISNPHVIYSTCSVHQYHQQPVLTVSIQTPWPDGTLPGTVTIKMTTNTVYINNSCGQRSSGHNLWFVCCHWVWHSQLVTFKNSCVRCPPTPHHDLGEPSHELVIIIIISYYKQVNRILTQEFQGELYKQSAWPCFHWHGQSACVPCSFSWDHYQILIIKKCLFKQATLMHLQLLHCWN